MSSNQTNLREFKLGLAKYADLTEKQIMTVVKRVAFGVYRRVLQKTPVNKGFLRAAWTVSIGSPDRSNSGGNAGSAKTGQGVSSGEKAHFDGVLASLANLEGLTTIYITNAMPYVLVVEFGGYPNPPKRGSWVSLRKGKTGRKIRGTGQWVIKSSGGFSRQAPRGMAAISIEEEIVEIQTTAAKK